MKSHIRPARDYRALRRHHRKMVLRQLKGRAFGVLSYAGEVLCLLLILWALVMSYILLS